MNMQPWKEKVHLWNTIKVSTSSSKLTFDFFTPSFASPIAHFTLLYYSFYTIMHYYFQLPLLNTLALECLRVSEKNEEA
jgi:hypothetical protein